MLFGADRSGDRSVTSREKNAGSTGLSTERFNIARSPHIVDHYERGLLPYNITVPIDTLEFAFAECHIVVQRPAHLSHAGDKVVRGLSAGRDPNDAVGECLLYNL